MINYFPYIASRPFHGRSVVGRSAAFSFTLGEEKLRADTVVASIHLHFVRCHRNKNRACRRFAIARVVWDGG